MLYQFWDAGNGRIIHILLNLDSSVFTPCLPTLNTTGAIAALITSLTFVYSTVYSDADQRKHQSSASLAFLCGIHRGPVNSPHKGPVTRIMFPWDDVIMLQIFTQSETGMGINHIYDWRKIHRALDNHHGCICQYFNHFFNVIHEMSPALHIFCCYRTWQA